MSTTSVILCWLHYHFRNQNVVSNVIQRSCTIINEVTSIIITIECQASGLEGITLCTTRTLHTLQAFVVIHNYFYHWCVQEFPKRGEANIFELHNENIMLL